MKYERISHPWRCSPALTLTYSTILLFIACLCTASAEEVDVLQHHFVNSEIRIDYRIQPGCYYILRQGDHPNSIEEPVAISLPTDATDTLTHKCAKECPRAFFQVEQVALGTPLDSDGDGIDDLYELRREGLDPLDSQDALSEPNQDGVTALEIYQQDQGVVFVEANSSLSEIEPAVLTQTSGEDHSVGTEETFSWTSQIEADAYWVQIGTTRGGRDLHDSDLLQSTNEYFVHGLPEGKVWVRLWSRNDRLVNPWQHLDYHLDVIPQFVPGEILVTFTNDMESLSTTSVRAFNRKMEACYEAISAEQVMTFQTPTMQDDGVAPIRCVRTMLPVTTALERLAADPNIASAQPNYYCKALSESNDPGFTGGNLWGMYGGNSIPSTPFGSNPATVWSQGAVGSRDVVVGVIDTGIQLSHPDLIDNAWINPHEIPNNGLDDDGNGYVDDVQGWDFAGNDNDIYDSPSRDGHGTHVAGTIGATGGNGIGVVGVNWKASLLGAKFLDGRSEICDAIKAVEYMIDMKRRHGLNLVAINNSWRGPQHELLHRAIIRCAKNDILFVCAAGNSGSNNDTSSTYPASYSTLEGNLLETAANYEAVISVASIDSDGNLASTSNFGESSVDLAAPGVDILSTYPESQYATSSGTSMAAPHVTGAIALFRSVHPGVPVAEIPGRLLGSTVEMANLEGKVATEGRLDIGAFVGIIPSPQPPVGPSQLVANISDIPTVRLSWRDESNNELKFIIERANVDSEFIVIGETAEDVATYVDNNVSPDTSYRYRVVAHNSDGLSPYSNVIDVRIPDEERGSMNLAVVRDGSNGLLEWHTLGSTSHYGLLGDIPVTGDWNGSNQSQRGVVRPSNDGLLHWFLDTDGGLYHEIEYAYGLPGDIPIVGDWDQDGISNIGVVRKSPDGFLRWYLDTDGDPIHEIEYAYGLHGDIPVVGDWDQDGTPNIGVVREGPNGFLHWFLDTDGDPEHEIEMLFGLVGDIPVVGDWTLEGIDNLGVVRTSPDNTLHWLENRDDDPEHEGTTIFGRAGDRPIVLGRK